MSVPNPGSIEAKEQGCTCPSMDNFGGKVAPFPPDGWWMDPACPLHTITPDRDISSNAVTDDLPLDKPRRP